jgi:hypothetical protein
MAAVTTHPAITSKETTLIADVGLPSNITPAQLDALIPKQKGKSGVTRLGYLLSLAKQIKKAFGAYA